MYAVPRIPESINECPAKIPAKSYFPRLVWFEMFTPVTIRILTIAPVLIIPECPDLFGVVTM